MFKALYFGAAERSKMASKMVVFKDYEGSFFKILTFVSGNF